jgi:hypothetical protein
MSGKYTLEIISRDVDNDGETFQSYDVDGNRTIGVGKREPFAIRFKNNTWNRIQLRLSVDGTDILTGKKASTNPKGKMWVVEANDTLEIEAWPEDNSGGARFVFGEAGKGVAVNTHGDTRGVGLIAAAVFNERYLHGGDVILCGGSYVGSGDVLFSSNASLGGVKYGGPYRSDTKCAVDSTKSASPRRERRRTGGQKTQKPRSDTYKFEYAEMPAPAVGAGEHVDQTIVKTAGLRNPSLDEVIEIKYEWWTRLRKKIGRYVGKTEATAFPADDDRNINLRGVPKQRSTGRRPVYKYL